MLVENVDVMADRVVDTTPHAIAPRAVAMAPAVVRAARRATSRGVEWLPTVCALAVFLGLWALLTSTGIVKFYVLPGPGAVASAFVHDFPVLWSEARITLVEALAGFAIGNGVAVLAAIGFLYSPLFERSWYPVALISRGIPMIALVPVLVLWLGTGLAPKIGIAALSVVVPTLINMRRGLRSSDADAEELLHTLSATELQRLTKVRLPASLPYLFASLRVATCTAFIAATIAEWVSSNAGLGYLIETYGYEFEIPSLWAAVFSAALLCLATFALVSAAERFMTRWNRAGRSLV